MAAGSLVIFPLNEIKFITNWDSVPDGWLFLGSVIGDGAYLVSDEKGDLLCFLFYSEFVTSSRKHNNSYTFFKVDTICHCKIVI